MLKKYRASRRNNRLLGRVFSAALFVGAFAVLSGAILFKNSFAETTYTVYFRNPGANNATFSTQTVAAGGSPSIPGNPSATGYTFSGNYQSSSALSLRSGGSIAANTPFSSSQISNIVVNSNLTISAVMTGNKYTVTTVMTGTVPPGLRGSSTTFTYSNGLRVNLPSMAAYAKNGYTFNGWSSEVSIYNNSWFYLPTKDIRVVGSWSYSGSAPASSGQSSSSGSGGTSVYSAQPSASASNSSTSSSNNSGSSSQASVSASSSPSITTPKTGSDKISALVPSETTLGGQVLSLGIIAAILAVFTLNHRRKLSLRSR